ncbi:MAG TPA: CHAT domain-containing tetratricopeptide repeat protein [Myxococcaceae bacterium]|nr:CHAT domain-containing tetratricopeptide repeat protein [Myxococcaceae bacterium]
MLQPRAVVVLWGVAAAAVAQDAGVDARLVEAEAAFKEAKRFEAADDAANALSNAERACGLWEAALGGADPKVAECLSFTGLLYYGKGEDGARGLAPLRRAISIQEAALGKSHPDLARSLYDLGSLYYFMGFIDEAESLYQRSLDIREAALGKSHPDVAKSLVGLACVYSWRGQYNRNKELLERALAIQEAALGKSHPDVSNTIMNLSGAYKMQGMYGQAEQLLKRAVALDEANYGKSHNEVTFPLFNLARIYLVQGLYRQAEPIYQRVLSIREATQGKSHPAVAMVLDDLAIIYTHQGLYSRAEQLHKRALAIFEAASVPPHYDTVQILLDLAEHYVYRGLYGKAEPLYERALAIVEEVHGQETDAGVHSLIGLGQVRLGQRRLAQAMPFFARVLAISDGRLRQEALDLSESHLSGLLRLLGKDGERLYSILRANPGNEEVRRLALTSALLFKGRSVEEAADTSRTILRSMGPQDREAFERLRGLRTHLAQLSLDGPGQLTMAEHEERLKRLAEEGDVLEADLAKRSAPLRALTALPSAADVLQRVTAALPWDGALVEVVAYTDGPPAPAPRQPAGPRYLAMVLFPDGRTGAVDLGPADVIDQATSRMRKALAGRDAHFQTTAEELYRLAFKPLLPLLAGTRKVLLAPDGQLALVPYAALHDGRRFLADTFDFTYLTSGRDLLPPPGDIPLSTSAVVFADPDYGAFPPAQTSAAERSSFLERFYSEGRAGGGDQRWVPLPGSRQEAEAIHRLLPQAQLFLGAEASKERLLHLAAPGILHIATHGFFVEDGHGPAGARALGTSELGGGSASLPDPLLRSGLVLAGATSASAGGASPSGHLADSLVTALELAGLDLWGTELVVLSACDTGRGDVRRGQGVYGLRRALVVAGAQTLVVSLWKADDETTRALMESYYRNLLAGQGRGAALREAMLSLRAQHPHPYYWAPFIALGSDAPLRGFTPSAGPP